MKHFRCDIKYVTVRNKKYYDCLLDAIQLMKEYEMDPMLLTPLNIEVDYSHNEELWLTSFPVICSNTEFVNEAL